jgi:hypothetical protein
MMKYQKNGAKNFFYGTLNGNLFPLPFENTMKSVSQFVCECVVFPFFFILFEFALTFCVCVVLCFAEPKMKHKWQNVSRGN